jgi:hypothetical protein
MLEKRWLLLATALATASTMVLGGSFTSDGDYNLLVIFVNSQHSTVISTDCKAKKHTSTGAILVVET